MSEKTQPAKSSQHIAELDGIRGIAVLMVIVWHYFTCLPKNLVPGTLPAYLNLPTNILWSGVDLFFVLSGFLIGGIILDYHRSRSFLQVFWLRRVCRILPAVSLLLLACWVGWHLLDRNRFAWLFADMMPWWTYVTFTQNIAMGVRGTYGAHFLGVTWSLAVEEQFYLVAPVLILVFGRKLWVSALLPLILAALLLRLLFPGFHADVNTVFRMDSLLSGVLLAVIFRSPAIWTVLVRHRTTFLVALAVAGATTIAFVARHAFGQISFSWFAAVYSLLLLVALLYRSSTITALLRNRVLCFFGAISYGLYLYHQAVLGLLHGWLRDGAIPSLKDPSGVVVTVLAFAVATTLAWASFTFFESGFVRMAKRRSYGLPKAAA